MASLINRFVGVALCLVLAEQARADADGLFSSSSWQLYPFLHGFLFLCFGYTLLYYLVARKPVWLLGVFLTAVFSVGVRLGSAYTPLTLALHLSSFVVIALLTRRLSLMLRPLENIKRRNQDLEDKVAEQVQEIAHERTSLEAVIESTSDFIYSLDRDLRFVTLNSATRKMYELLYNLEITLGDSYEQVTQDDILEVMRPLFMRGLAGEFVRTKVSYAVFNELFHREISINPIREHDNLITGIAVFSKDINSTERATQSLRYSESLLEVTFEQSPDALLLLHYENFAIMRCNQRAVELFEAQSEHQILGRIGLGFHRAPLPTAHLHKIVEEVHQYGVWSHEYEYKTFKQHYFWGILKVSSLLLDDNKGYLARISDITDRKQNEMQVVAKEANLRAILESNDQSIWLADADCVLIDYNHVFVKMLHQTFGIELAPRMDLVKSLPYVYQTMWKSRYKRVLRGDRQDFIDAYEHNGVEYIYQITGFPVYEQGNDLPTRASFFARDITQQVLAERKLSANQKLLDSINHHLHDALFRTAPKGTILYANKGFMEMFGYGEMEIYSIDVRQLHLDMAMRVRLQRLLVKHQRFENQECRMRRKDGSIFWAAISATQNTDENGETYYDGIIRDITEARRAKVQLKRQNSKLKKVNSELDRFVYSASHDLRAPLSSLLGLLDLVRLVGEGQERQDLYAMMTKSVRKLDEFINQIIQYSRNSRIEVKPEQIDVQELLDESFENLRYMPNSERIARIFDLDLQAPFYSDYFRLNVIFNNLVSNAVRYADLEKPNPFVKIVIKATATRAHVSVIDNGMGIDAEYLPHIFKMFYRASESSTGSGIGLYILKETLEVLKGKIRVESQVGEGTSFHLEIPNLPAPA